MSTKTRGTDRLKTKVKWAETTNKDKLTKETINSNKDLQIKTTISSKSVAANLPDKTTPTGPTNKANKGQTELEINPKQDHRQDNKTPIHPGETA